MLKVLFLLAAISAAVAIEDQCSQWPDCFTCLSHQFCGWCSTPVLYQDGSVGKRCAGFNQNNESRPFVCNGIYSTEQCISGYVCDPATFTCNKGKPGEGVPLDQCLNECKNDGRVFACNATTKVCYEVPPGHGSSYATCMADCNPQPTQSPGPTPTPAPTFECNQTSWKCEPSTPGHGSSKEVCEASCFAPKPSNNTPTYLVGLWRGVQINMGFTFGEYSMLFTESNATLVLPNKQTIFGTTQSYLNQVWITIVTSPIPNSVGKVLKATWRDAPNGPETRWMEFAMGSIGGPCPPSVREAMIDKTAGVIWASQCLTPSCKFHLSNAVQFGMSRRFKLSANAKSEGTDYCSSFGQNCSYCLSHKYCGWCSQNVQYEDGTTGTRCAGFNPDTTKQPFVCMGQYSTEMCLPGYVCNNDAHQCVPTDPGNGMPLKDCLASCQPPAKKFRCNNSTGSCDEDPNGGDLGLCQAYCGVTPTNSTPTILVGLWRGLEIRNGYVVGEFDMKFDTNSVTLYNAQTNAVVFTATVQQQGPILLLTLTSGPDSGKKMNVLYQFVQDDLLSMATFAFGVPNGLIPATFDESMHTPPETEHVMSKCNTDKTYCTW